MPDLLLQPRAGDPPNKTLINAVLDGLKNGVIFLVDNEIETSEVHRLVKKTERLASEALVDQFGVEGARKFFVPSENAWILRTAFGGWVFFYPIEDLTPDTNMDPLGDPDFVYWPDVEGQYARVSWDQWSEHRTAGHTWRPKPTMKKVKGPRSIWERLRER